MSDEVRPGQASFRCLCERGKEGFLQSYTREDGLVGMCCGGCGCHGVATVDQASAYDERLRQQAAKVTSGDDDMIPIGDAHAE